MLAMGGMNGDVVSNGVGGDDELGGRARVMTLAAARWRQFRADPAAPTLPRTR